MFCKQKYKKDDYLKYIVACIACVASHTLHTPVPLKYWIFHIDPFILWMVLAFNIFMPDNSPQCNIVFTL